MNKKKNIFIINGSASNNSANQKLIDLFSNLTKEAFDLTIFQSLKSLPHFDPEQSISNPPPQIIAFRDAIEKADGVVICTPEYVFSIPSGLKNAIEWCVATTVFSDKPLGIITASAHGKKGHEELQMIMKTIVARFTEETTLLIQGIKGKINEAGNFTDKKTEEEFLEFIESYKKLINS